MGQSGIAPPVDLRPLADRVRAALEARDLDGFGALLSDDVRWGDGGGPRACRNRGDVLATFRRLLAEGADGSVTEVATGTGGILCGLGVRWPDGRRPGDRRLYHVYLVADGRITEIRRYDDRASATEAAGIP